MALTVAATLALPTSLSTSFSTKAVLRPAAVKVARRKLTVCMSSPDLADQVAEKIKAAEETCADPTSTKECAAAWDEVEEIAATISHEKAKAKSSSDPLEQFCEDNPEADECRVYSD